MTTETILQELLVKTGSEEEETSLPLPMDHVFYKFSTSERRTLYDYAIEVSPMFALAIHTPTTIVGCRQAGLTVESQRIGS